MVENAGRTAVANQNFDDIEAPRGRLARLPEPGAHRAAQGEPLAPVDGPAPRPAPIGRPGLDLGEDQDPALEQDEVELLPAGPPVAGEDPGAAAKVKLRREVLSPRAEVRRRAGSQESQEPAEHGGRVVGRAPRRERARIRLTPRGVAPRKPHPAMMPRVLALLALAAAPLAAALPDAARRDGWAVGAQAWVFNRYTAFEAVARAKDAGAELIELYPGQPLRPGSSSKVHHRMPVADREALLAECRRLGVRPVSYGVVDAADLAEVREILAFAKSMGMELVATESAGIVADWETGAREFDLKVAFHHHPGSLARPDYRVWHPLYLLGIVESRDRRLGVCADSGHWCASGIDPVQALRVLRGRVLSVHLKDKAAMGPAEVVTVGKGVLDVRGFLAELRAGGFDGPVIVEHENDWQDNRPQVAEAIRVVRASPR